MKNRHQIDPNFDLEKKTSKNRTKIGFGRVLGLIWEGFWRVLGPCLVIFRYFLAYFVNFFDFLAQLRSKSRLGAIFVDLSWIRGGFWKDFGLWVVLKD